MPDEAKARRTSIIALQSSRNVQTLRKTFSSGSKEIPPLTKKIWPGSKADTTVSDRLAELGQIDKIPFIRRYRSTISDPVYTKGSFQPLLDTNEMNGWSSSSHVSLPPSRKHSLDSTTRSTSEVSAAHPRRRCSLHTVPIYSVKEKIHNLQELKLQDQQKRRRTSSSLQLRSVHVKLNVIRKDVYRRRKLSLGSRLGDPPTEFKSTLTKPKRTLSASDSHLAVRKAQDEDTQSITSKKESKGKSLRQRTFKKLKDEVFTPVMERARRVSVSVQETFSKSADWDSDDEDDSAFGDIFGQTRIRRSSILSTDSDFSFEAAGSGTVKRHNSYQSGSPNSIDRIRQRRKSAAGFLMSYAANKIKTGIGTRVDEFETEWNFDTELDQWQHPQRENYPPVETHVGDLHPKELQCLQGISVEKYNDRETGTTAVIPKDPSRKKKRSGSFKRKTDKERTKLVAGGIFGVPLNVVLEIDAMNGGRSDTLIRCIRDKKRKKKQNALTPVLTPNDSPKLTRRFGSLKSRSPTPIASPTPRRRPNSTIIGYSNSSLNRVILNNNKEHIFCRSLSTPTTPLDSRKIRTVSSTSALFNVDDKHVDQYLMNDLMYKLKNAGSNDSLWSTGSVTTTLEVPKIIINTCEFIEEHGLELLGLFRICGAKKDIRTLRAAFSACSNLTITPDTKSHVVAGLLKEFMKELPEALMTKQLYYPFLYVRRLSERSERLEAYKELIRLLPQANRDTLQYLLNFFGKVTARSVDTVDNEGRVIPGNKMNCKNLATMIGPNLLHRRKAGSSESRNLIIEEAWEFTNVIEVTEELFELNQSLFMVDAVTRQFVLRRMYNTRQDDLETVLNEYTESGDYNEGSPHSPQFAANMRSEEKRGSLMINGSSGFVSGGCGSNSSIPEEAGNTCNSRQLCLRGLCDRQHSSPELSTIKLADLKEKRLSRSLDHSTDLPIFTMDTTQKEADNISDEIASVDSSYDLTPPGSPIFSKGADRRSLLCRSGLKKGTTTSIAGHAALPPNVTFTKFGIDKISAVGPSQDSTSHSSVSATSLTNSNISVSNITQSSSPKIATSRRQQLRKAKNTSTRRSYHESEV